MIEIELRPDEDPGHGNYVLFAALFAEAKGRKLDQTDTAFFEQLMNAITLYNRYSPIEPCDMFTLGCQWTKIANREGFDSSELISKAASKIGKRPRPGAKKKNIPKLKKLTAAFNKYKKQVHITHGAKQWIAVHIKTSVSAINRAADLYIKEDNLTPNQAAAMEALRKKSRKKELQ